jgi:hypothetical protein
VRRALNLREAETNGEFVEFGVGAWQALCDGRANAYLLGISEDEDSTKLNAASRKWGGR